MQNFIITGKDNPVVMNFTFTGDFAANGLNTFTSIEVAIGGETYTTTANPNNLFIQSDTQLRLRIGDVTALSAGSYPIEVVGYSVTYDDGYLLTGEQNKLLGNVNVT